MASHSWHIERAVRTVCGCLGLGPRETASSSTSHSFNGLHHAALLTFGLILALGRAFLIVRTTHAQTAPSDWSRPVSLYHTSGILSDPTALEGPEGQIHVFWIENTLPDPYRGSGYPEALFHSYTTNGTDWSTPRDILIAPSAGRIHAFAVALDETDRLHLLLADTQNDRLYYTSVNLPEADSPGSWSKFRPIVGSRPWDLDVAYANGALYVAYVLAVEPYGVYLVRSDDHGFSWSLPVLVAGSDGGQDMPASVSLAVGREGRLHVAWHLLPLPSATPPLGVYYAHSADGGFSWSQAETLAEGTFADPSMAVSTGGDAYVVWDASAALGTRHFRHSPDGGDTWREPVLIGSRVAGLTGTSLSPDSAGVLHFVTPIHVSMNGIAYAQWNGGGWSPMIGITQTPDPPAIEDDRTGYQATILVTGGNQLNVVYLGIHRTDVMYVKSNSAAPATAPRPAQILPTAAPSPEPSYFESPAPSVGSETAEVIVPVAGAQPRPTSGQGLPVTLGLTAVVLTLGVVVLIHLLRRRS